MTGRDRLRELLDAVLAEDHRSLAAMASTAYTSPFHFTRVISHDTGESPVAMRRRVMLERAAWQLRGGTSVTDASWAAGYDSVEGSAARLVAPSGTLQANRSLAIGCPHRTASTSTRPPRCGSPRRRHR